ncbi:hypothetical protein [Nocardia sp. BMG111209]|uniref:hypothetical protein n=1 Tax=Nocardia sp. BMG111209 TaxID=1160137 RepID=UPI0012DFAB66|nr:hypothetical protein [Nocardia sp. BMG111209]
MTTWTLTTEQPTGFHRKRRNTANRADAVTALVDTARAHIRASSEPTKYVLEVDGEVIALLVSVDDGHGRPDGAHALELLERMDLPRKALLRDIE